MAGISSYWHSGSAPRMDVNGSWEVVVDGLSVHIYGNVTNGIHPGYWGYYGYNVTGWVDVDGGWWQGFEVTNRSLDGTGYFDVWGTVGEGYHEARIRISCGDPNCGSSAYDVEVASWGFNAYNPSTPATNVNDGAIFSTNNSGGVHRNTIQDYNDKQVWWDWWGQRNGTPWENEINHYNVDCYKTNDVNSAYSVSETDHYTQNTRINISTLMSRYGMNVGDTLYCWVNTCLNSGSWLGRQYLGAIKIKPYPPTCTAVNITAREATTATFNGTFNNNGGSITNYTFGYKKSSDSSWNDSNTTSNSRSISGLTPNTKYDVRARAYNSSGWGSYKTNSFYTKPSASQPTASNTARDKTTATVKLTKGGSNYPDINLYSMEYKKASDSSWTTLSNNSTGTWNLTGLTPNTQYQIRGRTRTNTGLDGSTAWSSYSSTVSFYTKPSAGSATAQCVKNNTQTSIDIKTNTSGTYYPGANAYQVRYKLSSASTWTEMTISSNQTQTINNLTSGNTYNIQVRARTAQGLDGTYGYSAWSSSITVQTVKKPTIEDIEFISNTVNSVTLSVSYINGYPNANRIYYALVPEGQSNPGRISNMYVATSSSPTTFTISQDYQGNPLTVNRRYTVYIYVNQYKSGSDWYTAGLDLNSNPGSALIATSVVVGTMTNIKCVKNNTYNSLTIHAESSGTWTVYAGWHYRFKKSSESIYPDQWSSYNKNDKVISGLSEGETYNIQVRGTTGITSGSDIYFSQIYEITIRVVKRPKMTLELYHIRNNEIGVKGRITDTGYPEITKLQWIYKSSSYITLTYTPNSEVIKSTVNFNGNINVNQNYNFTQLYNTAKYNIIAGLSQYKAPNEWYTAGIDNRTDIIINNVELAMYNSRTDRLRGYSSSWKNVNSLKSWDGSSWKDGGTQSNPTGSLPVQQVWGSIQKDNPDLISTFSYFNTWIPGIDPVRFIGASESDNSYGGNLLENKIEVDFSSLRSSGDVTFNSGYTIQTSGNTFSMKKNSDSNVTSEMLMSMNITLPTNKQINNLYIEYCQDIIPANSDNIRRSSLISRYSYNDNYQSGNNNIRYTNYGNNKTRFLVAYPVYLYRDDGYKLVKVEFYNGSSQSSFSNITKAGTIFNISNFKIYYTTL